MWPGQMMVVIVVVVVYVYGICNLSMVDIGQRVMNCDVVNSTAAAVVA